MRRLTNLFCARVRWFLLSVFSAWTIQSVASAPPGVVSINLCADQLVLALADPGQIRSLSHLSHDPAGSAYVDKARHYPTNKGRVEEILPLQPDVVIAGLYTNPNTINLLKATGTRVETVSIAFSLDDVFDNIKRVAGLLGQQTRGDELIAALTQRVNAFPKPGPGSDSSGNTPPRAAIYDPNGYTVGDDTLRGDILLRAGWYNVAKDRGISNYGSLPLETLLKLSPDVLVASPFSENTWSRAQALNAHPALMSSGLNAQIITVPSAQTICGGPWTVDVIERLISARLNAGH